MNNGNKFINYLRKYKKEYIIICAIILIFAISISFSMFIINREGKLMTLTIGNISIEYIDGDTITANNSIPLSEKEIEEYAAKKTFSFKNIGDVPIYVEILLDDIEIDPELQNSDFRWALYEGDDEISNGNFANIINRSISLKRGIKILSGSENTSNNYKVNIWINDNGGYQNSMLNKHMSAKITVKGTDKTTEYVDGSGANPPELATGLIPVMYDENSDTWIKANPARKWYDYNSGMWANAVTVEENNRETYENAEYGTEIKMSDINSMWVWIPRFKYKVTSNLGSNTNIENPTIIDVEFESGLKTSGIDEPTYRSNLNNATNSSYYTHPAFINGRRTYNIIPYDTGGWDTELSGFWVGKFETSTESELCISNATEENCKNVDPIIKPDNIIINAQNISSMFKTSLKFSGGTFDESTGIVTYKGNNKYGLTSSSLSHMAKNTEWGAVAYLSQSKYGKFKNSNYDLEKKEIYVNNSNYSGRSAGETLKENSSLGNYSYNDKSCDSSNCDGEKTPYAGSGASTTGTIYGVYDMSGGALERVMANWNRNSASSGFVKFPEEKYYDNYFNGTPSNQVTLEKVILGDAIWETMKWYSDNSMFIDETSPWINRGGNSSNSNNVGVGIYNFNSDSGEVPINDTHTTFRTILIP